MNELTMKDYIQRTKFGDWNSEAMRLLATLPWPTVPCPTCGHFPPKAPKPENA